MYKLAVASWCCLSLVLDLFKVHLTWNLSILAAYWGFPWPTYRLVWWRLESRLFRESWRLCGLETCPVPPTDPRVGWSPGQWSTAQKHQKEDVLISECVTFNIYSGDFEYRCARLCPCVGARTDHLACFYIKYDPKQNLSYYISCLKVLFWRIQYKWKTRTAIVT